MSWPELVWRYKVVGLLVLLVLAYVASWRLRRERHDVEALRKFVLSAAALLSMLAVSGFILLRLPELGTPGEVILLLVAIDAISRFHTVLDRWKELRGESKSSSEALVAKLAQARAGERELEAVPPVGKEGDGNGTSQPRTRFAPSDAERKAAEREAAERKTAEREAAEREAAEREAAEEEAAEREAAEKAAKKKTR